jgi:predicted porin
MKKSAIALAVAAAVGATAVAQADTTLYGSARLSVDYDDVEFKDQVIPGSALFGTQKRDESTGAWDLYNNASRLGVRGSEDLGGGLSAIYQFEFGVDTTEGGSFNNNRPKWVGLKSGFGSVMLGTQWTTYYNVIGISDIFNTDKFALSPGNFNALAPNRTDNTLLYMTPDWGGFHGEASLIMNGLQRGIVVSPANNQTGNSAIGNTTENIDAWSLSGIYKNGPFFAGLAYMATGGDQTNTQLYTDPTGQVKVFDAGDRGQFGLGLGYNDGTFGVTLNYENGDIVGQPTTASAIQLSDGSFQPVNLTGGSTFTIGDQTFVTGTDTKAQNGLITFSYTFGPNVLRLGYDYLQYDDVNVRVVNRATGVPVLGVFPADDDPTVQSLILGYQYNLSKRTRMWFEYLGRSADDNNYGLTDRNLFSLGMRHDF